jgi:hypothetical protein
MGLHGLLQVYLGMVSYQRPWKACGSPTLVLPRHIFDKGKLLLSHFESKKILNFTQDTQVEYAYYDIKTIRGKYG